MNILKRPLPNGPGNITFVLLGINILVFFLTSINPAVYNYLVLSPGTLIYGGFFWTPITYQFAHSGINHILFNMLGLVIVGTSLERFMGSWEFLLYYLLTGVLCGLGSVVIYFFAGTNLFLLGASGSIYGILLAFAVFYPNARFRIYGIIPVKSTHLIFIYAAMDILPMLTGRNDGVGHLTHLLGFVFGALYLRIRLNQRPLQTIFGSR